MTPEQVSALSDTELNLAMIWLYYLGFDINYNPHINQYVDYMRIVDYLTDYNLTMQLVIEHEIGMDILADGIWCAYHGSDQTYSVNYLRAVCECLVLIALDKNKPTTQTPPQIG